MNIILFDNAERQGLFPLTINNAVANLRVGIFTIKERWEMLTGQHAFIRTAPYLQPLYSQSPAEKSLWIDASVLPDNGLVKKILSLDENTALTDVGRFIAGILPANNDLPGNTTVLSSFQNIEAVQNTRRLKYPWQIFQWNDAILRDDFSLLQLSGKSSQALPGGNNYIGRENIFIEEGAEVIFSSLNASPGPIFIGKNAVVMEGCLIRGPFVLGEGAVVKMGTKIYGATTLGPYCSVGGEIKNVVMQGYSNKGHDGYLGDSVIGNWCNLGAGTSNSNVKNTGSGVKMWSYSENSFVPVGAKGGVIIGDYSRTAINTSLNTGTVTGICCNMFENGLLPKYVPGFTWGGRGGEKYQFDKAVQDITNWKKMKNQLLDNDEIGILKYIFDGNQL